jgi:DnaJ-class molecular chaperone
LSDEKKRQMYDMGVDTDQHPQEGPGGFNPFQGFEGGDPDREQGPDWIFNMMNDMFGGGGFERRREPKRQSQNSEDIRLSLFIYITTEYRDRN